MFMVFQYLQHISTTIYFYFRWKAISHNHGQKCWHSSKTNAFYLRPCVNSKNIFFAYSLTPLSPFSMLKYASLTLPRGYNNEKGRGGLKVKIWDWKTHAFNETGLFEGVSQLLLSMIVAICKRGAKWSFQALPKKFDFVWFFWTFALKQSFVLIGMEWSL